MNPIDDFSSFPMAPWTGCMFRRCDSGEDDDGLCLINGHNALAKKEFTVENPYLSHSTNRTVIFRRRICVANREDVAEPCSSGVPCRRCRGRAA